MMSTALLLFIILCVPAVAFWGGDEDEELPSEYNKVTYGSTLKLKHEQSSYYLHSHEINWGSGSGQQSVTGMRHDGDANSLWQIYSAFGQKTQSPGTIITCDSMIRLRHVRTGKYLHSHMHKSPLSKRQEVSGYEHSDTGDNWKVVCPRGQTDWLRAKPVNFQHKDTGAMLYMSRRNEFDNNNCRGCPINGQLEASALKTTSSSNTRWMAGDGYFFPEPMVKTNLDEDEDDW